MNSLNLDEFDRIYRLSRMAIDAEDGTPGKEQLIEIAEDEMMDLLKEAQRIFLALLGEDWLKKIGALSSTLSSIGVDNAVQQLGEDKYEEVLDLLVNPQKELIMAGTRISSQVGFMAGFVLGLMSMEKKKTGNEDR